MILSVLPIMGTAIWRNSTLRFLIFTFISIFLSEVCQYLATAIKIVHFHFFSSQLVRICRPSRPALERSYLWPTLAPTVHFFCNRSDGSTRVVSKGLERSPFLLTNCSRVA